MGRVIWYESSDIRIRVEDERRTDRVVIHFDSLQSEFGDPLPERKTSSIFRGFDTILVSALSNHCWQVPDLDAMCAALRAASDGYAERLAYGSSMRGYGALMLAGDIGCTRILAVAPQAVYTEPSVPLHPIWSDAFNARPFVRDDVVASLSVVPEIVYDPDLPLDAAHVRYLQDRIPIRAFPFPHAGHKVLQTLKECGILKPVMTALLQGDARMEDLRALYDPVCERSPNYLFHAGASRALAGNNAAAAPYLEQLEALDPPQAARLREILETGLPTA
ncbi:hypothetical protein C4N9_07630 [Pararhodobacter marinus]|uniref:Alpha/beta hydrolase n=1 Tax=Pararhodobacter marinus TaxID=2184063 RepID=A0A2U2CCJ0_9RHOB|nr:hypothetical protein [Pararhodobacter marinus]PWE29608.1 hypothetical protein C4N9_07630 [Pararhodobacter marinus]